MTDICKKCGCNKSLTNDKDCPICPFGEKVGDVFQETINKESVVVTSGPDPEFDGRYRAVISGDKHDMEDLHNFLLAK